jgi:membrane-bound lytic murein transglycosylase D
MRYARTAALLTSVFSASITVGYGTVPTGLTRAVTSRLGWAAEASGDPAPAPAPGDPAPASSYGAESGALRVLRSPEFEMFGERGPAAMRPQTSRPTTVCGTGAERRLCSEAVVGRAGDAPSVAAALPDANWMVGLRAPDIPVHASVRVERFFKYLTESTNGRKLFRRWLARSGRYHDVVARALRERGLPEDLEALVFVESGYSPTAVSSEGAAGLWQFMPGTGRVYGLAVEEDYDERRSIEKATEAGTRYLSDLHERFGSWELAMAAYDMGYGRLTERVQELSTNDYWTLSLVPGALPDEALAYVPKVIAVALLLRNLDRFGFDGTQVEAPVLTSDLDVPGGTPLSLVARAAGTSVDRLRALNPELLAGFVPDRGRGVALHVPSRGLARANTMLPRLLARWHPGSSDRVDDSFDWGSDELLPAPAPGPRRTPRTSLLDDPLAAPTPPRSLAETEGGEAVDRGPDSEGDESGRVVVFYRVDEGETLAAIAQRFDTRPSRIIADNHLDPSARLQKGMLLKLRVPRSALSRLASVRTLDDSQYAPAVPLDRGSASDSSPFAPPAANPELRPLQDDSGVWPGGAPPPPPRVKRTHGGRASGRRSMADFAELFARKP